MIPPVSPSVLATNPQFEKLHKQLTTEILNPDASTRSDSAQYEHTKLKLRSHHVKAAKQEIVKRSLRDLVGDDTTEGVPPELRQIVFTVATYVTEAPQISLSQEAHDLLAPEIEAFIQNLSAISPLLTKDLQQQVTSLLHLTTTTPQPPCESTKTSLAPPSSLPTTTSTNLSTLSTLRTTTLPQTTTHLSNTLTTLLSLHTTYLISQIRHLELHTHGILSRHTHARATYLSSVAAGLDAKTRILALQATHTIYTPDTQRALATYAQHLRQFAARLRQREDLLRDELEVYFETEGGGEALKECARRYAGVLGEIEEVRRDIARLEQRA